MKYPYVNNGERGDAMTIIMIAVVAALIGAVGWLFWQNYVAKDKLVADTSTAVVDQKDDTPAPVKNDNEKYLTIDSWNVRFTIPDSLKAETVTYVAQPDALELQSFGITTSGQQAMYKACKIDTEPPVSVARGKNSQSTPHHVPLNGGQPIDGYYYFITSMMAQCGVEGVRDSEPTYHAAIQAMIETVEAY